MAETLTIRTSASTDVIKVVERGPQGPTGPTGPTGPAGEGGASTWNDITGKPSTFAPSAHASTHHTGGSDPLTAANIGAAKAITNIELEPNGTTTITTSQLPARGIAFIEGGGNFTVNLPTPGLRESGLWFSIKTEHESFETGDVFITVVHNAVNLLTAFELTQDEGSIDFLWDGYAWTYANSYLLRSFPGRELYMPLVSGTLAIDQPADNVFRVVGSSDATKKVAFEVDTLVSSATTRTLTVPNSSGTIALLETLPAGGPTDIWIPASAWIPRTSNGCGVDSRELATNDTNWDELLFDAGADEFAQAVVVMPSNYNNGTITARFYWTASTAGDGTDDVIWGIQGRAFADSDALDAAFGSAVTVTDTLLATNDMHVTSATSAATIDGSPAANRPILFQIYRDADAAGDTYSADARLLGVEIIYTAA